MGLGLARYADDPVGFVEDALGEAGKPYEKQAEMLRLVAAHRRVSVVGCNSSGKDWTAARLVLWWIETRPQSKAIVTGPTQRQVEEVLWREMRVAHALAASRRLSGKMYASKYVVNDERFALGFSTDHAYNLQGFHSPELLVVVTEAHGVGQDYVDALKRLNPKRLLLTGNPLTLAGEFYDSHHSKSHLYERLTISAFDTPNLLEGRPDAVPGMLTPEDVEEHRRDWGEQDRRYLMAVLGAFPPSLEDSLVSRTDVDRAVARWEAGSDEVEDEPWIMGVDVARFGDDDTVLCLRRGPRVEELTSHHGLDTMQTARKVHETARACGAQAVFVDEGGVGGGVVDRLKELGAPVIGVYASGRARQPERYENVRAEMFWEIGRRMREGEIAAPDDRQLISQLLSLRYHIDTGGRLGLMSKQELKKEGLPSPDKADALAMAFLRPPAMGLWM